MNKDGAQPFYETVSVPLSLSFKLRQAVLQAEEQLNVTQIALLLTPFKLLLRQLSTQESVHLTIQMPRLRIALPFKTVVEEGLSFLTLARRIDAQLPKSYSFPIYYLFEEKTLPIGIELDHLDGMMQPYLAYSPGRIDRKLIKSLSEQYCDLLKVCLHHPNKAAPTEHSSTSPFPHPPAEWGTSFLGNA